jgi:hypothetical protein
MTEVRATATVMIATAPGRKPVMHVVDAAYCDELIAALRQAKAVCVAGQAALDDEPAESRVGGDEPAAGEEVQGAGDGRPVHAGLVGDEADVKPLSVLVGAICNARLDELRRAHVRPRVLHLPDVTHRRAGQITHRHTRLV